MSRHRSISVLISGSTIYLEVPLTDRIPAKRAEFFYNREVAEAPTEFVVIDQSARVDPGDGLLKDPYKHLLASGGAHSSDWLDGTVEPGSSPEALFAQLWLDTSSDRASIKNGLSELSKIEGCEWAEKMLGTLDWIDKHWRS